MSYCKGLESFETGFDHAAHIVTAALLVAVLIAEVNINFSEAIAKLAQTLFHYITNLSGECFVTFDIMTSIDLYLHGSFLLVVFFCNCDWLYMDST
nr:hypothetical protein [Spirulina major]